MVRPSIWLQYIRRTSRVPVLRTTIILYFQSFNDTTFSLSKFIVKTVFSNIMIRIKIGSNFHSNQGRVQDFRMGWAPRLFKVIVVSEASYGRGLSWGRSPGKFLKLNFMLNQDINTEGSKQLIRHLVKLIIFWIENIAQIKVLRLKMPVRILSYFGYLQSIEWQYGWVYAIWYWIVMSHDSDIMIILDPSD